MFLQRLGNEIELGQGSKIIRMIAPESAHLLPIAVVKIDAPQVLDDYAGVHLHFVGFVVDPGVRSLVVEPAITIQQVGIVLVVGLKALDHQLRQGQRLNGLGIVFPEQEGFGAGDRRVVETVPPDLVRVDVLDAVFVQNCLSLDMGHVVHVGTGFHERKHQVLEGLHIVGVREWELSTCI
ncbi:hypothetical protein D3C75_697570 [compost metagenome]